MFDFDELDATESKAEAGLAVESERSHCSLQMPLDLQPLPSYLAGLFGGLGGLPGTALATTTGDEQRRGGIEVIPVPPDRPVRIACISDIHTDRPGNLDWLKEHLPKAGDCHYNVLILPGDVSDGLNKLTAALEVFAAAFDLVCFVPGNHDLWCLRKDSPPDSLGKLRQVLGVCDTIGVCYRPVCLDTPTGDIFLLPLLSWYTSDWDREPDLPYIVEAKSRSEHAAPQWVDFHAIKWPAALIDELEDFSFDTTGTCPGLSEIFARVNESWLPSVEKALADAREGGLRSVTVISFSHFLPRQELTPEKRYLVDSFLPKVSGSDALEQQIRRIRPDVHVVGHTHLPCDARLEGQRYVQWPLGSPAEQKNGQTSVVARSGFLVLYSEELPEKLAPWQYTFWGRYFKEVGRDPQEFCPAPWVRRLMERLFPQAQLPYDDEYFFEHTAHPFSPRSRRPPPYPSWGAVERWRM